MQDLIESLRTAVKHARFESTQMGALSPSGLQDLYRRQPMWLATVDTQLDQIWVDDIVAWLKALLPNHIEGDRVVNGLAFFLRGSAPISVEQLARYMVRTSAVLGVEPIVRVLADWERGEPISFESYIVLDGVSVERSLETSDGIRVVPLPTSSDRISAELPMSLSYDLGIMSLAGAAKLIMTNTAWSAAFREQAPTTEEYDVGVVSGPQIYSGDSLDLLCRSLALAVNGSVRWRAAWSEHAVWRAFGNIGSHMMYNTDARSRHKTSLDQATLLYALSLFEKQSGDKAVSPRLRLAIERWVMSKNGRSFDDQLIDLRIVLEALYLSGGEQSGEYTFRVAYHGAWHLGTDFRDRDCIFQRLRDLYALSSRAVHGNTRSYTDKDRELLADVQDLCRRSIIKILNQGYPNFRNLALGDGPFDFSK